jgi:hypothetical protein
MANKRIDQLPPSSNDLKGGDLLAVCSNNKTERITLDSVSSYSGFTTLDTYVSSGIFNTSTSTITLSKNNGDTIDISGITTENTFLTGGTFENQPSFISNGSVVPVNKITTSEELNTLITGVEWD